MDDLVIQSIAAARGVSAADVCLKWAITRGHIPIPFSVKRSQYEGSFRAAMSDPLTDQEMEAISKIDRHCRLIKGQVFLWEGADDWKALWDE